MTYARSLRSACCWTVLVGCAATSAAVRGSSSTSRCARVTGSRPSSERVHQLLAFARGQEVEVSDRLVRLAHGGLQQVSQVAEHATDAVVVEQVGAVLQL